MALEQDILLKIEVNDDILTRIVSELPDAGRMDPDTGFYILPREWDNPEDDEYEKLL